jgi:tryptophan synthase alpha chain
VSRISDTFAFLRRKGFAAYIPYICAGDPSIDFSRKLIYNLVEAGADILEIGIPFSDPIADGPLIQGAMMRSLSNGFQIRHLFELISEVRAYENDKPIIIMSYLNPIIQFGTEHFCELASEAGADGLLFVDLPLEESKEIDEVARSNGLDIIRIIAPTSDDERINRLLRNSSGFVYVVSVAGVTGPREKLPETVFPFLKMVKDRSHVPVVLGFGISGPHQAALAVMAGADGVVEGSNLIRLYNSAGGNDASLPIIANHVREMKVAIS